MSESSSQQRMTLGDVEPTLLSELIRFALITLLIVLPIRLYIAQPFVVSGSSMDPTFHDGEYLIIDEISYRFNDPQRGDVIVFRYPKDQTKFFIKRIIGLPNETITIDGPRVVIHNSEHPEGITLDEQYLVHPTIGASTVTLGSDEYFVMGDNRPASSDSRIWGTLSRNLIIGHALTRLLPLSRIDFLPGAHTYGTASSTTPLTTPTN